ncbi:MAG: hypothetical protein BWY96_02851 [Spirochaetes bacterium ADurb.BinA120]|nr:MAG: hypothetical protein BWY96_02851 [Spirochaetes bacterium ADurb.BinA120]
MAISRAATMLNIMQLVCPMCRPDRVGSTQPVADQSRRCLAGYLNSASESITASSLWMEGVAVVLRFTSAKRRR